MLETCIITLKTPADGLIAVNSELEGTIRFIAEDQFKSIKKADYGAYHLNAWKDEVDSNKCTDVMDINLPEGREYPFTCTMLNGKISPMKIYINDKPEDIPEPFNFPLLGYRPYKISDDYYYLPPEFVKAEEKLPSPSGKKTIKVEIRLERDILTPGTSEKIHYVIKNNSDVDVLSTTLNFVCSTVYFNENDCEVPSQTVIKVQRGLKIFAGVQENVTEAIFIPTDLKHTKIDKEIHISYALYLEVELPHLTFKARTPVLIGGQEEFRRVGNVEINSTKGQ